MRKISLAFANIALLFLVVSCQTKVEKPVPELSPEFTSVLEAHGDWQKWYNAKAESYAMIHEGVMTQEDAFINLDSRKIRLMNTSFEIGYNGNKTLTRPNRDASPGISVIFYHNL